ncbi:helix-turn-helix domain-containing protein [Aestuariivirga litoralis]|uniref:helix-turn-helix domain-containing protein n=1 Tax=Aestuariivirga litoralis TaxID=2650924 RepID=UPI0018C53048|nr:XRE family transcriptional regulator [Aestuariivirga litoralis]MBG1232509.1 helix-turn-helix domain-containing protein [Aestuariivirga litoralis]
MTEVDATPTGLDEADLRLGRKVRALRLERNLSLAELAGKAGMSLGALSQIERGLSSLRVKVLWQLAAALEVEPTALIVDSDDDSNDLFCVRSTKRRRLPVQSEGIAKHLLSPPGAALTGMMVKIEPGGGTTSYAHTGHEFGIVTSGEVELVIDQIPYVLREGDSFAFKSTLLHSFRNEGAAAASIVWVNMQKVKPAKDD